MKKAIIYTRVSTAEQANHGFSLARQEADCKTFASNNNYEILKTFVEQGESAKTTDRTELKNLMEYCTLNRKNINALIVWKIDRLSRNMEDYYFLNNFFNRLGIEILSSTEINDNSAVGKLTRNMLGAFAQFENDQKTERTKAGMLQALLEGKWLWKAPFGYKMINGDLIIDPETAPIVKQIYELFATGLYKQSQIIELLKRENIHIKSGQIFCILRNCLYCGLIYCPSLYHSSVRGAFEPIISEKLYNKVQLMLNNTDSIVTSYSRNSEEFPLRRFINCPNCGSPLTASKSTGSKHKKYAYYHCYNDECHTQVRIPKDKLESLFIEYISELKPRQECITEFKKNVKISYKNAMKNTRLKLARLNNELKSIEDKRNKLLDLYLEGKIKETDYKYKSDTIENEEMHIKQCLSYSELPKEDFNNCLEFVCNALENIDKLWLESDLDTKQKIQQLIFPNGLTYENNGFRIGQNSIFFNKKGALIAPDFNMVPLENYSWKKFEDILYKFYHILKQKM